MTGTPTGVLDLRDIPQSVRAYATAAGFPSPTLQFKRVTLEHRQCNTRIGIGTDGIGQSAYFVERDGLLGTPVEYVAATWTQSTERITLPTGALTGVTLTSSAHVWVYDATGGWTVGTYAATKIDDETLELENGPSYPVDGVVSFWLLLGTYAELYLPVGVPTAATGLPAKNDSTIEQSPWHSMGPWIPPGAMCNGGIHVTRYFGRLRSRRMGGRPFEDTDGDGIYDSLNKCVIYFTCDPHSSTLVGYDIGHNETQYLPPRTTRYGATPELKYTAATFEDNGSGSLRVVAPGHGYANGTVVHITSFDGDATAIATYGSDLGPPSSLVEGQGYYVGNTATDKFRLYYDPGLSDPVPYANDAATGLIVSKMPRMGSRHSCSWKFVLQSTEQWDEFVPVTIELWCVADGRTAEDEQGVYVTARMIVGQNAEQVGSTDRRKEIVVNGTKVWDGTVWRTTPGNSMSRGFDPTDATAAPLSFVKNYFTPADTVAFTAGTADDAGNANAFLHTQFESAKVGDEVVFTTLTNVTGASTGVTYYVHSKPNASNPEVIRITTTPGGSVLNIGVTGATVVAGTLTPSYGAFVSAMHDWGGRYDKVAVAELLVAETTAVTGLTDYPIGPTFQGTDVTGYTTNGKNSQGYRAATVTVVERAGVPIGEVCYHDNLRREMWVRPYAAGEHVRNGDALTLKTYRNTRAGGTASSWTWEASPVQTKIATAKMVQHGPHGTQLSTRFAISGPPTGDVELNIRASMSEQYAIGSR